MKYKARKLKTIFRRISSEIFWSEWTLDTYGKKYTMLNVNYLYHSAFTRIGTRTRFMDNMVTAYAHSKY